MPPSALAIIIGVGPHAGAGIARAFASSGLAVAVLARTASTLEPLAASLESSSNGTVVPITTDTTALSLKSAFEKIRSHPKLSNIPLSIAVWNIKHSHKTPFEEETAERFSESLQTYITGAFNFSHEVVKMVVSQSPEPESGKPLQKRGTLIFTGTLGALRANSGYGAYGAGRSGVRMLAQSLAREMSPRGIHVVHTIANGGIGDETEGKDGEEWAKIQRGEKIKAESVGKTYLWLAGQGVDLWTHELDMRPAAEKF